MRRFTELQDRVASLHNLLQIVGALRSLAAARLQEARSALSGIRGYSTHVAAGFRIARQVADEGTAGEGTADGVQASGPETLLIAFLSEHGFVGSLNTKVLDLALGEAGRAPGRIIAVGTRGAQLGAERGAGFHAVYAAPSHASGALPLARKLADHVYEHLSSGKLGRLVLCYPRPIYDAQWEPAVRALLPFAEPRPAGRSDTALRAAVPPLTQMPRERLLAALLDEWLFAEIMQAEMEAFAAENAARLMTMESVHANVTTRADLLAQQARVLRQDDITTELIDILVGAESARANGHGAAVRS